MTLKYLANLPGLTLTSIAPLYILAFILTCKTTQIPKIKVALLLAKVQFSIAGLDLCGKSGLYTKLKI